MKQLRQHWHIFLGSLVLITAIFFRTAGVITNPPSLYWEEVALGYDAYALRITGKDHHGNLPNLIALESYGDWKPPLYAYLQIPFQWVMGLNAWSVRLPAVLAGIWLVFGIGRLATLTLPIQTQSDKQYLKIFAWLMAGLMPWLIVFSRAGWETMVATSLITWGVVHLVESWQIKTPHAKSSALLAALYLGCSLYTYHGARFMAPAIGGLSLLTFFSLKNTLQHPKIKVSMVVFLVAIMAIAFPLAKAWRSPMVAQRLQESSVITGLSLPQATTVVIKNILGNFTLKHLFLDGDHITRYSGVLLLSMAPILFMGLVGLGQLKPRKLLFVVGWMIIGTLPSAISGNYPHGVRTIFIAPMLAVILAWGLWQIREVVARHLPSRQLVFWACVGFILSLNSYFFWFDYNFNHRLTVAGAWQYGYEQAIDRLTQMQNQYPDLPVKISRDYGRPLMFYWFYAQIDPRRVQAASLTAKRDQGELLEFENLAIFRPEEIPQLPNSLVMLAPQDYELVNQHVNVVQTIFDLERRPVWYVGIYQPQ